MKILATATALSLLACFATTAHAQVLPPAFESWTLRVLDSVSGDPVPGMTVELRSDDAAAGGSLIQSMSDANGYATLTSLMPFQDRERVLVFGSQTHHYTSREDHPGNGVTRVFVTPYSAFHKTPTIAAGSTGGGPFVFTGTLPSPAGVLPYMIAVDVPLGVLQQDSQIWIAPKPMHHAITNHILEEIPAHFGQFHIQLRDASGTQVLSQTLPAPGIKLTFTPWFLPASEFPIQDNVVVSRVNLATLGWDVQTPKGTFSPDDGLVHITLRQFSGVDCKAERWANAILGKPRRQTTPPTPTPPPVKIPGIELEDCLRMGPFASFPIKCGKVQGKPERKVTKGTTYTIDASITAEIATKFSLSTSGLTKLLAKASAEAGYTITGSISAGASYTTTSESGLSYSDGQSIGPGPCWSGSGRLAELTRRITVGGLVSFDVFAGVGLAACLEWDEACGENCHNPPADPGPSVWTPAGQPICDGEWPGCK